MPTTLVKRNEALINNLSTDFVKLYSSPTSWGNVVSMNLGLPYLIAYWPMNIADENDDVYDISWQGHTLTHYP